MNARERLVRMTERYAGLTVQDLEIMNVVWDRGEVTVREVHDALLERRAIAYTSVITILAILESNGK